MAQPIYAVTYRGVPGGSKAPVVVDSVGPFVIDKPAIFDQSRAQSCGFATVEDMIDFLWHPEAGVYSALDQRATQPRWDVAGPLSEEQVAALRQQVRTDPPHVTVTGAVVSEHETHAADPQAATTAHSTKEVK